MIKLKDEGAELKGGGGVAMDLEVSTQQGENPWSGDSLTSSMGRHVAVPKEARKERKEERDKTHRSGEDKKLEDQYNQK